MFRRAAALAATAALATAGLLAAAPLAQAEPAPNDDPPEVRLLDDLTLLPVQACGLDVNLPILSTVLGPDAPSHGSCSMVDNGTGGG